MANSSFSSGPSGCGKSTLLRPICGLEDATAGDILLDKRTVNENAPPTAGWRWCFRAMPLYPHMTVFDRTWPLAWRTSARPKARSRKSRRRGEAAAAGCAAGTQADAALGGQRQRVAIGRAIVREPKIFLFDEPLSNLDAGAARVNAQRDHRPASPSGATMIYVTHDQVEAMTMADKIVVPRGGRVEQVGAPLELYNHPANTFVSPDSLARPVELCAGACRARRPHC